MKEALNKQSAAFSGRPFPYSVSVAHSVPHGNSNLLFTRRFSHSFCRGILSCWLAVLRLRRALQDEKKHFTQQIVKVETVSLSLYLSFSFFLSSSLSFFVSSPSFLLVPFAFFY